MIRPWGPQQQEEAKEGGKPRLAGGAPWHRGGWGGRSEENSWKKKTVANFGCRNSNMSGRQRQRGERGDAPETELQLAVVQDRNPEVVEEWGQPISVEMKNWTMGFFENKL